MIGVTVTVVGLTLGALIFIPHVATGATGETLPGNADTVVFTFSNPTIIPLEDVNFSLAIVKIGGLQGGRFSKSEWLHRTLAKDGVAQIRLEEFVAFRAGYDLTDAEISVIVTYRVWEIPYNFTEEFHYAAKREPDGSSHWFARPAN